MISGGYIALIVISFQKAAYARIKELHARKLDMSSYITTMNTGSLSSHADVSIDDYHRTFSLPHMECDTTRHELPEYSDVFYDNNDVNSITNQYASK